MFSGCAQLDNSRYGDWLVDDIDKQVTIAESADSREIVMDNGLIRKEAPGESQYREDHAGPSQHRQNKSSERCGGTSHRRL